jgi:outer membrane protein TolC
VAAEENKVTYTLDESIKEALANNPSIQAKKERIEGSIFRKNQAMAEFLPKLGTSYGYNRLSESRTFRSTLMPGEEIAVSSQDNYEWRGTLRQPIFTGFGLISSYELAKLGIDQSETELELEILDLGLRVKEAYYNILIADRQVEVAEKDVESRSSNAEVVRSFYEVGMIPINELLQAEVELANSQQALVRVQNEARLARSAFNTVLSRPVNTPLDVEDILEIEPEVGDFEEYQKTALEQRPEIKIIDTNILQADQQIRLAKSKYYPEISFTYEYIKEGDEYDVSGSPFHDAGRWEAMAVASWTFWEWGKTYYSAKEKESSRMELMQTRQSLEDRISLDVKRALLELETAERNIPSTRKAVEQGEENLRVSEERYKAQVTTITEVLDAQTRLSQARVNYYRALYSHKLAEARLQRAMGEY